MNKGAGGNLGFPDVCFVPAPPAPPIPVPFTNEAMNAMAVPFSGTVMVSNVPALHIASEIPLTSGDEPGVGGPSIKGPGRYLLGNNVVHVDFLPAANQGLPTTGNNMNDALGLAALPSIVNVFYTHAGAPVRGAMDADAARDLARSVAPPPLSAPRLEGGVACLSIPVFSTGVPAAVYSALRGLALRALVLDLRGCPGGEMIAAIELGSDFLDEGAIVVTAIDADGDETVYRARGERRYRFPLLLVVDGGTASAAEIFAGCLQAHGRAVVVGERTYGKGSAQRIVPDRDGPGAVYATVASFALPDGQPIEGRGVRPDVEVPGGDALEAARALALSTACEVR
jgi:carboxyl-terminal processing protease